MTAMLKHVDTFAWWEQALTYYVIGVLVVFLWLLWRLR